MPENYSQSPLLKKLVVKPAMRIAAINAFAGYRELLGALPEGTTYADASEGTFDWLHLFVKNVAELEDQLPAAQTKLKLGATLWLSFPRAKNATDLNRTRLIELLEKHGVQPVSNAVVNDEWTAYRLKPIS